MFLRFLFTVRSGHLQLLLCYWLQFVLDGTLYRRQEMKQLLLCYEAWLCFCCSSAPIGSLYSPIEKGLPPVATAQK